MSKVKLTTVSGTVIEKPIVTCFKNSVGSYLVLDNEKNGTMGLPIILVCRLFNAKLTKIIDQGEWQTVKESLKSIIAGNSVEYEAVPAELAADDVFYTQLTLPVNSFESLKSGYAGFSGSAPTPASVPPVDPMAATPAPADVPPVDPMAATPAPTSVPPMDPMAATPAPTDIPPMDPMVATPAPTSVPPMDPMAATPAPTSVPPMDQMAATPAPTSVPPMDPMAVAPAPASVPPMDPMAVAPAPTDIPPMDPMASAPSPASATPTDAVDVEEIKKTFMQACETMFDALVMKMQENK